MVREESAAADSSAAAARELEAVNLTYLTNFAPFFNNLRAGR